jgi:hypothetical protein
MSDFGARTWGKDNLSIDIASSSPSQLQICVVA